MLWCVAWLGTFVLVERAVVVVGCGVVVCECDRVSAYLLLPPHVVFEPYQMSRRCCAVTLHISFVSVRVFVRAGACSYTVGRTIYGYSPQADALLMAGARNDGVVRG